MANIWKHSRAFRRCTGWLQNFAGKGWFRSLRNWSSAWCDRLLMALTSSFQLWFMHCLKRWIDDFPSFEMRYSMHQMGSRKCSKSVQQLMSSWILHVRFLYLLSSLHSWFFFGKGLQISKAWILHVNELPIYLPWIS